MRYSPPFIKPTGCTPWKPISAFWTPTKTAPRIFWPSAGWRPTKGIARLIDAFAVYHHQYNTRSRLFVVGKEDPRLAAYTASLHEQVDRLEVAGAVVFTGEVSESLLKTHYLLADAFLMTSQHEGFGVPLIEAMAMNVPLVALGTTAVPGTIGEAGLVWEENDPYLLAESIHQVTQDQA